MKVTTWRKPSRVIALHEIVGFYGRPLDESHAFLFETSALELPTHGGSFSLKLVLAGEEEYFIGRRTVRVRPGDLLFVNAGESYGSRIRQYCRSLSLFFSEQDLASVNVAHGRDPDASADVPQVRYSASRGNWRLVAELVRCLQRSRRYTAAALSRSLLDGAFRQLRHVAPAPALANVRKRSTRDELVGRIVRSREYIEDMRGEHCSLDELAAIACLSRYHFLRVFREVIGCSPVAFARARRVGGAAAESPRQN